MNIIRDRVNGTGISDAEVAKSGDNIIISVPGVGPGGGHRAGRHHGGAPLPPGDGHGAEQLLQVSSPTEAPTPGASPSAAPSSPRRPSRPSGRGPSRPRHRPRGPRATPTGKALSSALTSPARRAGPLGDRDQGCSPSKGDNGRRRAARRRRPRRQPEEDPKAGINTQGIDPAVLKQFDELDCTDPKKRGQGAQDDPNKQYAACETDGTRQVRPRQGGQGGRHRRSTPRSAGRPARAPAEWLVQLDFKSKGATSSGRQGHHRPPSTRSRAAQPGRHRPRRRGDLRSRSSRSPITGGRAQISGSFNQKSTAAELADQLKYGALPLKFERSSIEEVSSTLGDDQLRGGLIAGAIGLALVVIYSLLYYRGLGIVAVLSLVVASILTYAAVVVLGHSSRVPPVAAAHHRPDRLDRHHRRLLHRLLRTHP